MSKKYKLKNDPNYFLTGHLPDGRQIVAGVQLPDVTFLEFSKDGDFLRHYSEAIQVQSEAHDHVVAELKARLRSMHMKPNPVSMKPFYITGKFIGIKNFPDHLSSVSDGSKSGIAEWRKLKCYVFDFDEEYYISESGEVESS